MRNLKFLLIAITSAFIACNGQAERKQSADNSIIINLAKENSIDTIKTNNKALIIKKKADFIIAYNCTVSFEGGYVNDSNDKGGETYKGISRVNHPEFIGWEIIDAYKQNGNFPKILSSIENLELMVRNFYKKEYWIKMRGDEILDQKTANLIFDSCVNMGVFQGIKISQSALGISKTGIMDDATLKALNSLL